MSDSFYRSIEPVDAFESLALLSSYVALPDDWSLVVADVVDSTVAIEAGRYKEVNTVGVSVIAATLNVLRPVEVPYIFGGDGALLCIPERFAFQVEASLAATVAMARSSFGLDLRAAIVPSSYVRGLGLDLLVANTDFRKFDGCLRLVLAGTATQRTELDAYLAGLRDSGEVVYGMHVARSALMTCLIEKRKGAHFHFVDAAGGGYAAAARNLKRSETSG